MKPEPFDPVRKYERLVRRLRSDPRLWDEDDRVYNLLGKALERLRKLRRQQVHQVGPYSGLTRQELRQSGTCEPDWF